MNERDSEIISQSLFQSNYEETNDINRADLIIINTCSIRAKAEQKVMSLLGYLRKNKRKNPRLKICVAGCVAQQRGQAIIEKMPHVDLVVGTQHIYEIPQLLEKKKDIGRVATSLSAHYSIPRFRPTPIEIEGPQYKAKDAAPCFSKYVTIMQGCNNYCTYCVVPYTRGREVSRNINDIIDEVEILVDNHVKEIILLGQNVNSYGLTNPVTDDGSSINFPDLLRRVSKIKGLDRLRFTTSNPKDLSDDLMRCFRELENLCPQFHLPVQSGSDAVLQRMNRKYSVDQYLGLVASLRNYSPDIAITTDIIVGFPGETDADFLLTMDLLEKAQFSSSFSFKYSDRPDTASADFDSKISEVLKSQRLRIFQKRQNEISLLCNKKYIGKKLNVMVEDVSGENLKCRAVTNHVVHSVSSHKYSPGDILEVYINHAGQHSLKGTIIV